MVGRVSLFLLAWLGCTLGTSAQTHFYVDSLLVVFDTARQDTDRLQAITAVSEVSYDRAMGERYNPLMEMLVERLERDPDQAVQRIAQHARVRTLLWSGRLRSMATDHPGAVRHYGMAGRLAASLNDSAAMALHASEMRDVYLVLGDTVNSIRYGYRCGELALALGDSALAVATMLRTSRIDTSMAMMEAALALGDNYYRPGRAGQGLHFWQRAWTLTAHHEYDRAIEDLRKAEPLLAAQDDPFVAVVNWTMGEAFQRSARSQQAIAAFQKCIDLFVKHDIPQYHAGCARRMGDEQYKVGNLDAAESAWREAAAYGHKGSVPDQEMPALFRLKELYIEQRRFEEAVLITQQWMVIRDSMARMDATKDLMRMDFEVQQHADSILNVQQQEAAAHQLQRERTNRNVLLAGAIVAIIFGGISYRQRRRTQQALARSDELLLNILPEEVAEELKAKGEAEAVHLDQVTVLFTDFKGFTAMSEQVTPRQLVHDLHECFSAFDRICEEHGIEKIKTIGDAYMAAGGLPVPDVNSARNTVLAGLEMQAFMKHRKAERDAQDLPAFEMRVGIHTGPVVAGIVGVKKFQYDIWGDTVNTASRMESSGEVGQVNISEATYALVKDAKKVNGEWPIVNGGSIHSPTPIHHSPATAHSPFTNSHSPAFAFTPRGKVQAKGKGEMEMYFVERKA